MNPTQPEDTNMDGNPQLIEGTGVNIFEVAARACHEANREYCLSIGDESQPTWDDAPDWQKQSALDGVRAIYSGRITTPGQTHESWLTEKSAAGWKYGPVKDAEAKTHPCFLPYESLPEEQKKKDEIFLATAAASFGFPIVDGVIQPPVMHDAEPETGVEVDDLEKIGAAEVARQIETSEMIEHPEIHVPIGTEIVKEAAERWTFKLPGKPWANGKGKTIAGAMLDAGLIR